MKIVPIGKKLLIKNKQPDIYFPGTTILKPGIEKEYIAEVVAIGTSVEQIEVGSTIQYADHANAIKMQHKGEEHLLISSDMVLAMIEHD
jgi:co-chaperonin GroES (HSP10)